MTATAQVLRDEEAPARPQTPFADLLPYWTGGQVKMPGIVRWKKYLLAGFGGVRRQNNLQHTNSIAELAGIFLQRVRERYGKRYNIDELLLMRAFLCHDRGEAEIGTDTLYINKSDTQDEKEALAYDHSLKEMPYADHKSFLEAFLLQFGRKNPNNFRESLRGPMRQHWDTIPDTVLAFETVERWDYLLYAEEQYRERGNLRILVQVARNQFELLDKLTAEFLPCAEIVWPPEVRAWYENLLRENEGKWPERRSRKKK